MFYYLEKDFKYSQNKYANLYIIIFHAVNIRNKVIPLKMTLVINKIEEISIYKLISL